MTDQFMTHVRNAKKPTKRDAQQLVRLLADQIPERRHELARLYQYFRPSLGNITAAAKNPWKWAALAAGKHDVRQYLNYIQSKDGNVAATDGHRLHTFKHKSKAGLYDPRTFDRLYSEEDANAEGLRYPDWEGRVILTDETAKVSGKLGEPEVTPGLSENGLLEVMMVPGLPDDFGINAKYWEQAVCIFGPDADVRMTERCIQIEDGTHIAVIMAVRL